MVYPIINGTGPLPTTVEGIYKVDMHVHYGALPSNAFFARMAAKRGINLEALHGYRAQEWVNLKHFHTEYGLSCGKILRDPEDYAEAPLEYFAKGQKQNLILSEISGGISLENDLETHGKATNKEKFEAIEWAFEKANQEYGIKTVYIASIVRDKGPEHALEFVREAIKLRERFPFIRAIGMAGDESCHTKPGMELWRYADAFKLAKAAGMKCNTHAGEISIVTLNQTIDYFGSYLDRIGHGIHAVQDIKFLENFIKKHPKHRDPSIDPEARPHCVLEICPAAYSKLNSWNGQLKDLVQQLWSDGFRLVPGTDDPWLMQTDPLTVYQTLHEVCGLDLWQLAAVSTAGIKNSFLPEEDKNLLYMRTSRQKHLLQHQSDVVLAGRAPMTTSLGFAF